MCLVKIAGLGDDFIERGPAGASHPLWTVFEVLAVPPMEGVLVVCFEGILKGAVANGRMSGRTSGRTSGRRIGRISGRPNGRALMTPGDR